MELLIIGYIVLSLVVIVMAHLENEWLKDELYQLSHTPIDRDKDGIIFEGTSKERKMY